jgi:hypothetical protein
MPAPNSRTVRVFLSSTFRDFTGERDLLVKTIFPELRRRCRERSSGQRFPAHRSAAIHQQADRGGRRGPGAHREPVGIDGTALGARRHDLIGAGIEIEVATVDAISLLGHSADAARPARAAAGHLQEHSPGEFRRPRAQARVGGAGHLGEQ